MIGKEMNTASLTSFEKQVNFIYQSFMQLKEALGKNNFQEAKFLVETAECSFEEQVSNQQRLKHQKQKAR